MRKITLNRKGVAILLVSILILVSIPVMMVMFNLSSSQKEQSIHFNQKLNVEQISLSGINMGNGKLKKNTYRPDFENLTKEISGNDRFDLSVSKTGKGFFNQDIYMVLSKSEEDKNSSIILADAEQFQQEKDDDESVLVITHDYWTTSEPYEISEMQDILSIKTDRGLDQLRSLEIKKYELESDEEKYKTALSNLGNSLPKELQKCWDTVIKNLDDDKIVAKPPTNGGGNKNNNPSKPSQNTDVDQTPPDSITDTPTSSSEPSPDGNGQKYDDRGFPINMISESETDNGCEGNGENPVTKLGNNNNPLDFKVINSDGSTY